MTLLEITQQTQEGPLSVSLACQLVEKRDNVTKSGKPYFDIEINDGTATGKFKIWEDTAAYKAFAKLRDKECIELHGVFTQTQYGLDVKNPEVRKLEDDEKKNLFAGTPERQARLANDWKLVETTIDGIKDPRLRAVCQSFLQQYGERFRRAAAARDFHHARRGGLLEHVAQMMRAAVALRPVYPHVNWDLVAAGVLFHDCGKLWENDYEAEGFVSPISTVGELLGHISIGLELVNKLWRGLENNPDLTIAGTPHKEQVREHLLHLIASHHGQREYGAPVTPRTPEAWALHYIDNLDAKIEMLRSTYEEKAQVAPGIYDYRRPLEGHAVQSLPEWKAQ